MATDLTHWRFFSHNLNKILRDYGLTISVEKSKVMAFRDEEPRRSKTVIENKGLEQVNTFDYLGTLASYENEKGIDCKISKFLKITGIISNILKTNKVRKNTRIKLYFTLALPVLLYGNKSWTIKAKDKASLISAEMKFMRRTAGYIWSDFRQNIEILKELKVTPIQNKISNYKTDGRDHVNRMSRPRLPKLITQYIPKGRRDWGRPMKKLTDGF
jgi:hypothetical protein